MPHGISVHLSSAPALFSYVCGVRAVGTVRAYYNGQALQTGNRRAFQARKPALRGKLPSWSTAPLRTHDPWEDAPPRAAARIVSPESPHRLQDPPILQERIGRAIGGALAHRVAQQAPPNVLGQARDGGGVFGCGPAKAGVAGALGDREHGAMPRVTRPRYELVSAVEGDAVR